VDARRFRMLIELDGTDAHEEDSWIGTRILPSGRFEASAMTFAVPDPAGIRNDSCGRSTHSSPFGHLAWFPGLAAEPASVHHDRRNMLAAGRSI